jgi:hypothetical protein
MKDQGGAGRRTLERRRMGGGGEDMVRHEQRVWVVWRAWPGILSS